MPLASWDPSCLLWIRSCCEAHLSIRTREAPTRGLLSFPAPKSSLSLARSHTTHNSTWIRRRGGEGRERLQPAPPLRPPRPPRQHPSPSSSSSSSLPREVTIYPDARGSNRNPPLEVEHQRSYTGPYVIPASLADQKCSTFGVQGLLDELNDIMGTSFHLSPSLEYHLARCISLNYDFGLAYSYLRRHWKSDFDNLAARMAKRESDDAARRRDALDSSKKYITDPSLPPCRVWDLNSNRVIPYYWWGGDLWDCLSVSHSWVAEDERSDIWTPINERE